MKRVPRGLPYPISTPRGWGSEMSPTRRDFLKLTTIGGAAATLFGFDLKPAYAQLRTLKIARANETRSTCPYCSVSCGVIIYTIGDRAKNVTPQVVHVEGDPDHPINRGTLCPKGASLEQDILNERRLLKPQVRRPGGTDWEDISWDTAIEEIAQRVKKTRDETAIEKERIAKQYLLNYTNASFVVKDGFKLPEDGLYSGFDHATQVYDKSTWNYEEGGDLSGKPASVSKPTAASAKPVAGANGKPA